MALVSASLTNNNIQVEVEGNNEVTAIGYQNEYAKNSGENAHEGPPC